MKESFIVKLSRQHHLFIPLMTLAIVVIMGVFGFMVLEGISMVDAIFWLAVHSAISHAEPGPETELYATIIVLLIWICTFWVVETVVRDVFGKDITGVLATMKNERKIDDLNDHFIICGAGEVGSTIMRDFNEKNIEFVVIEKDQSIADDLVRQGFTTVQGDAKLATTLERARLEKARGILVVTDQDDENLHITIISRKRNREALIISRTGHPEYKEVLIHAGADQVIIPEVVSGHHIAKTAAKEVFLT